MCFRCEIETSGKSNIWNKYCRRIKPHVNQQNLGGNLLSFVPECETINLFSYTWNLSIIASGNAGILKYTGAYKSLPRNSFLYP